MISLINKKTPFKYYINTTKTIILVHALDKNTMTRKYKSDWGAITLNVRTFNKRTLEAQTCSMDFESIVNQENDIFTTVSLIASTIDKAGYFEKFDFRTGAMQMFLNEYMNSEKFIMAKNDITIKSDVINMLEIKCPKITILLRNLFYNENDAVLLNFLNWIAVIAYKDTRQDILWLFKGTDNEKQGQGAGKGIWRDLMNKLLSGLVVSVNNKSYDNNFNSQLMNMKLIIMDELDFKTFNYETVKDMTGSTTISIEFKGKEPITMDNVSSWMFFTNQYHLQGKISSMDRRCFLIHPNPLNDSLSKIVGDTTQFFSDCSNELTEFINVLAHCDLMVQRPNDLQTKAHIEYFNSLAHKSIIDIPSISKIFTNKQYRDSFLDFLEEIEKVTTTSDYSNQRFFIENEFTNYSLFEEIYAVCLEHKIAGINKNITIKKAWMTLCEDLRKADYLNYNLDRKYSGGGQQQGRIKRVCLRIKSMSKQQQKKITLRIVKMEKQKSYPINNYCSPLSISA